LYVRVSCAQDESLVAVPNLHLRGTLTELEKRQAIGFTRCIPRALAYIFSTFGFFKFDGVTVVPLLPNDQLRLRQLYSCSFAGLVDYFAATQEVANNLRPAVDYLARVLPSIVLDEFLT
jgi:hypothetical protein